MNTYINRTIENILIETSKTFSVVMITGPKQVGKTTLLNFLKLNAIKSFNVVEKFGLNIGSGGVL